MTSQLRTGPVQHEEARLPLLRYELEGPALFAARAIVVAYALLCAIVLVQAQPRWLQTQSAIATGSGGLLPHPVLSLLTVIFILVAGLAWAALATLVLLRRSRDLFGLFLSVGFFSLGLVIATFVDEGFVINLGRAHPWAAPWPATVVLVASGLSLPWAYCFPDARFVPRWSLVLAAIWLAVWLQPAAGGPFLAHDLLGQPGLTLLIAGIVASTAVFAIYRYRRRSTPVQQQQLKWLQVGISIFVVVYLLVVPTGALILGPHPTAQAFLFQTIHAAILSLGVIAVPVAIGIAIFRQGLLDIDVIVNRTLTYGAITAILAVAFVIISGVSNLVLAGITGQRSEAVVLASVVPVALAFMPIRNRALKIADRFVAEHRVMTLLFVDIVGSTDRAYALGDRAWRNLLERFRAVARRSIKHCHGREIDTTGDGFFVTFEAPERAVDCAHELINVVKPLGLEVRVGVHIGEVEVDGTHVEGGNVHLAARVTAAAGASEVLVSGALHDVLAGSEVDFQDRGVRQLKGVPGDVHLFAAVA